MGQFSWLDCMNHETQIINGLELDVFALVPADFGGTNIRECCYDGYGNFGGYDIYDLVANWNRKYLAENPDFVIPQLEPVLRVMTGTPSCSCKASSFSTSSNSEMTMSGLQDRIFSASAA